MIGSNIERAIAKLNEAIALHQKHMNGTAPTSQKSQMEMMQMMRDALSALSPASVLLGSMTRMPK